METGRLCTRCVLPSTFPGISFDADGLCVFCQESPGAAALIEKRGELRTRLEAVIAEVRSNAMSYDCIVAFSGGKDSTYTLALLTETYQLQCLAVTIDNGFVAPQALENCRTVTAALGVDHVLFAPAPAFMNRMYRVSATDPGIHTKAALTRASSICNSCINLINNHMVKIALEQDVQMIAGGYIGGQVPKDSAVLQLDRTLQERMHSARLERYSAAFGDQAARYFALPPRLLARMTKLYVVNPMLTVAVSEDEILAKVATLGWKRTEDTGSHSTNCRLNDLGIAVHYAQNKFHPYVAELAEQVRAGLLDREVAIAKLEHLPGLSDIAEQAAKIGIPVPG